MIMCEDIRHEYNIKDIYQKNKTASTPMLSTYGGDFWAGYRENSEHFDRLFMREYTSFYPYGQDPGADLDDVVDEFRADVYAWLLANDKRYSELYRIEIIPDENYSLTNNYDMTETLERSEDHENEFIKGTETITTGTESVYGTQDNETSETITRGSQENTVEYETSAFNSDSYQPERKETENAGGREDVRSVTDNLGGHTDTSETSSEHGERTDTETRGITENSTLHRVGNIGVTTVDDMIQKHIDTWSLFNFYKLIFAEIAREFLRC